MLASASAPRRLNQIRSSGAHLIATGWLSPGAVKVSIVCEGSGAARRAPGA